MLIATTITLKANFGLPAFSVGVPAEKAGVLFSAIFFSDKNLKKGFPLQSLTQLSVKTKINFNSAFINAVILENR